MRSAIEDGSLRWLSGHVSNQVESMSMGVVRVGIHVDRSQDGNSTDLFDTQQISLNRR